MDNWGEALTVVWYVLSLFIGGMAGLLLNPPKSNWAWPAMLVIFMGFGAIAGPTMSAKLDFFAEAEGFAGMTAAALGWTTLKMIQRTAAKVDLTGLIPWLSGQDGRTGSKDA